MPISACPPACALPLPWPPTRRGSRLLRLVWLALLSGGPVLAQSPAAQGPAPAPPTTTAPPPAANSSAPAPAPGPTPASASAPDPLPRLLAEREALMRQYQAAEQQRNSLFGNTASKQDLEDVAVALRGIVAKDDEIVPAVKASARAAAARLAAANAQLAAVNQQLTAANAGLQTLNLGDRSAAADRLHELGDHVQNLEQKTRQQALRERDLLADAQEAQAARRVRDLLITALLLAGGTLGWLLYRRRAATAANADGEPA